MPSYVSAIQVDWGYAALSPSERALVRRHEASLQADPHTHTEATLEEAMLEASRALAGRRIAVQFVDEQGAENGFMVRDGDFLSQTFVFDENGRFREGLIAADYAAAGIESVATSFYFGEATLDAMKQEAGRLDRSLSWLVQRAWRLAGARPDLLADDRPPLEALAGGAPRGPTSRRKQTLYVPIAMLAELQERAALADSSMSRLVQAAVECAWPELNALGPDDDDDD